jgi:hypothetical protein
MTGLDQLNAPLGMSCGVKPCATPDIEVTFPPETVTMAFVMLQVAPEYEKS